MKELLVQGALYTLAGTGRMEKILPLGKRFSRYNDATMSSRLTLLASATARKIALSVPIRSWLWLGTESR
jgi:hypothetical protein